MALGGREVFVRSDRSEASFAHFLSELSIVAPQSVHCAQLFASRALTWSTFARIVLRFFGPPFDPPSSLGSTRGGGGGGRGFLDSFEVLDATFSFLVGRLANLADRPILDKAM